MLDVAAGRHQELRDGAEPSGAAGIRIDGRIVIDVLPVPTRGGVYFADSFMRLVGGCGQIAMDVGFVGYRHDTLGTPQIGAGV